MHQLSVLLAQAKPMDSGGGTVVLVLSVVQLGLIVLTIAGFWTTYAKAGKPGWAAIIPIYNIIVLLEIAGKPVWWFFLLCIPCVNFVFGIMLAIEVAKRFGKEAGFGVGLAFLPFIFYPILGFGDARYRGPSLSDADRY